MTTPEDIKNDQQQLMLGNTLVELFKLDTTNQGGSTYYFTNGLEDDGSLITFNTIEYSALPVSFSQLQKQNSGVQPRPSISLSNISQALLAEVLTYNGFIGSTLTVKRTYAKYLDGHSEEDPTNYFPEESFLVGQMVRTKEVITWELQTILDLEGLKIGNQALAICSHRYGTTDPDATCPYDGSNGYFTIKGVSTTQPNDVCGKNLTDCRLRYDITDRLPFNGYPILANMGYGYRR